MKIQNINLINFGIKKISNKKAYRKIPGYIQAIKTPIKADIFETYSPGKDVDFDKFENKTTVVVSQDGNTILTKEKGINSTLIELVQQDGAKTQTTRFYVNKKYGEKSGCSYKITENGKSKRMTMSWTFPGKNFDYKGSPKDMVRLKKALQNMRNKIHEKEYMDDFGYIREVNFQFKTAITYLQEEIENQKR